ncbi:hypothetical protein P9F83_13360 [Peribacillus psychrosaccharolyticus]|uniref:hypothetical protein n=1 Tax=Peribacillus psychrosaccharolyticus TaxID=1407 RepID=UPI0002E5FE9E|nr:hypothetical protein [Peribacillus psychrosaccharolyticus]MEC2056207.1 hypothetical protein [Peribacillus psychrosaccharolyticus]MED3743610.1 hypothetical protein [Peribacillus psychrosaccharolyticus]
MNFTKDEHNPLESIYFVKPINIIGSHTFTEYFEIQSLAMNEDKNEFEVVKLNEEYYEAKR